ncbi:MAG: hypothetical protein IJB09_05990 [Oscillospiraceae bacterium]|nr:hypothetical protein [Oscillospiraceae bacterium]
MEKRKSEILPRLVPALYTAVIGYIFFLVLAAFLYMAAVSTSFVSAGEKVYFLPDSPWANLAVFAAAVAVAVAAEKCAGGRLSAFCARVESDGQFFKKIRNTLLCAVWIALSLWALCTRLPSGGDQITVLDAAYGLAQRDFSPLSPVNYLYDYNHQIGLAMVEFLLNRVLGEYNYTAYHLINAALIPLIFKSLSELGAQLQMSRMEQLGLLLLCILFTPLALYVPFIYGTIPGLLFALIGIRLEIKYFAGGKWYHALLSALSAAFAVLLKSNYQIFMIGMLIYAIVEIIRSKKGKKALLLVFVAVFYLAQAKIPIGIFAQMRGAGIPEGVSKWAWVTMGLQEGDNPGWYNGYTLDTLIGSEFDTQRQEIWVKSDLKERISVFLHDTDYARDFFVRKTASQWNEPSFESVVISQGKELGSGLEWPKILISEQGNYRLSLYLNYLNFIIVAGAMLYLLLCSEDEHYHDWLMLAMIVIGGFAFHMVWEAKGQYTLPYFMLLLPYTVMGYSKAAKSLAALPHLHGGSVVIDKKALAVKLVLLFAAAAILWYVFHGTLESLTGDTAEYLRRLA